MPLARRYSSARFATRRGSLPYGCFVEAGDRQAHVLPGAEQVAELEVHHRRAGLTRPLERRPGLDLARQVVPQLLLDLRHAVFPPVPDHEKSPTAPGER